VQQISARLDKEVPVFLVGNSLGANLLTKYLGEEGLSGTLPACVAGGASLANPLSINSENVSFPLNIYMALGIKKTVLKNWASISKMSDPAFKAAVRKGLMSLTIADLDRSFAPILNRNEAFYPFSSRVGFKNGEAYWLDSSSYRHIRHISVPFLNLTAQDDFLASTTSKNKLCFSVSNPNVMVVETRCGGHLGWQESPPDSDSAFGASSWADVAAADFFDSIMQVNMERSGTLLEAHKTRGLDAERNMGSIDINSDLKMMEKEEALASSKKLLSRL
jgi:predicted alpha/beta-fold hydrolase